MSNGRIFLQEADRIRVLVNENRAQRRWIAAYATLLFIGLVMLTVFVERLP